MSLPEFEIWEHRVTKIRLRTNTNPSYVGGFCGMNVYTNYVEQGWFGDLGLDASQYSTILDWNINGMNEVILSVTFCFKVFGLGGLTVETNQNIYSFDGGSSQPCDSYTVSGYQLVGILGHGLWCISYMGAHFEKCMARKCSPKSVR